MSLPPSPAPAAQQGAQHVQNGNPLLKKGRADTPAQKFSFFDFLDIINPLQHIPIVNNVYRAVTGDQINNAARIAGGALYGGMVGAALGMANSISVNENGKDMGAVAMTKMGFLKDQDQEAFKSAKASSGSAIPFPPPPPETAAASKTDIAALPVIEVRPSDKNKPQDHIDWDKIAWDAPSILSAETAKTATASDRKFFQMNPERAPFNALQPAKKIQLEKALLAQQEAASTPHTAPLAAPPSAALPAARDLSELSGEPSNTTADAAAANPAKADVQKTMLDALTKYQAMQTQSDQNAPRPSFSNLMASPDVPVATMAAAARPSAEYQKLRRY